MSHSAFVYVMQAGDYIKIGVTSKSILQRAKQIQTGCPIPIEEILFFKFETSSIAFEVEKLLHKEFSFYASHGEWFHRFSNFTQKIEGVINLKSERLIFNEFEYFNKDQSINYRRKIKDCVSVNELVDMSKEISKSDETVFKRYSKTTLMDRLNSKLKLLIENEVRQTSFVDTSVRDHFIGRKQHGKNYTDRLEKLSENPLLRNITSKLLQKD